MTTRSKGLETGLGPGDSESGPAPQTARALLPGRWRVTRRILGERGARARFEGEAVIAPAGDGLWRHDEAGRLTTDAGVFEARQTRLWRFEDGVAELLYPDHRPLARFAATGGEAEHFCAPDRYRGRLALVSPGVVRLGWRVEGPRKAYVSASRLERRAASPCATAAGAAGNEA